MRNYLAAQRLAEARDRVAAAKTSLLHLRRQLDAELAKANSFNDHSGRLTEQGISERRAELVTEVRSTYAPKLEALQAQVKADRDTLQSAAAETRPGLEADAVSLMRAAPKWDAVKTQLDAGRPLSIVLRNADRDTVLAVGEYGPSYLEAKAYAERPPGLEAALNGDGFDASAVRRAVDARLAQLDDDFGQDHAAAADAQAVAAYFEPLLQLESGVGAYSPLEAAVAAHYADAGVQGEHAVTAADAPVDDEAAVG